MRSEVQLFPDPPLSLVAALNVCSFIFDECCGHSLCSPRKGLADGGSRLEVRQADGAVAQLGEHLLCKQKVTGSIPVSSTTAWPEGAHERQNEAFLVFPFEGNVL